MLYEVITAFGSIDAAVEAMKAGASYFLSKPFQMEQLLISLEEALRETGQRAEMARLAENVPESGLVGESRAMNRITSYNVCYTKLLRCP